jgi:hypothetical protein
MPLKHARKAASSHWFDRLARFGYGSKGLVWGVVGLLAARVALGDSDEQADFAGALGEIGEQPMPAILLVLLAVGLTGYTGWRLMQGLADLEEEGSDLVGWAKRLSYIGVGGTYGFFAVYAIGILAGWSTDDEGEVQDLTAMVLGWPLGTWLVGIAGVVVIAAGLVEIYYAVSRKFEVELGEDRFGPFERVCLLCTGAFGHFARGVVYSAAGFFALRAAVEFDPDEARGLAETFRELSEQPFGVYIVGAIGVGFISFGIYCILLAFHRHIPNEGLARGRKGGSGAGSTQGFSTE